MIIQKLIILFLFIYPIFGLDRDDLMEYLRYKQLTRSTFDGRIDQQVEPIGYVDGKPIWPRILERVKSPARIFFDDDNFAYETNESKLVDFVHQMDMEQNFNRVIRFLQRYTT